MSDGTYRVTKPVPGHRFLGELERALAKPQFHLPKDARIGIACSGGPDSLALLVGLHEIGALAQGRPYAVLHYRHGDTVHDWNAEHLVEDILNEIDGSRPLVGSRFENRVACKGDSGQMSARRQRYAFFRESCELAKLTHLLLGHTLDDQAETVLMRLTHGHWLDGLAGIPERRILKWNSQQGLGRTTVVRPMLGIPRELTRDYVKEAVAHSSGLDDPSNDDPKDRRHQFRHQVIPLLEKINPKVKENVAVLASQVSAATCRRRTELEPKIPAPQVHKCSEWDQATHWAIRFQRALLNNELEINDACVAVRIAIEQLGAEARRISRERCARVVEASRAEGQTSTTSLLKGISFRVTKSEVVLIGVA